MAKKLNGDNEFNNEKNNENLGGKAEKPKQKRAKNNWRVPKSVDRGPLFEHNEVRYPLPEVGSNVIVMVRKTYDRGYGDDGTVRSSWEPDDTCVDAWGAPLVYTVVEYKLGIDKPLARANAVRLEATMKSGFVYTRTLPTIHISMGYYFLARQTGQQFQKTLKRTGRFYNSKDLPIAELNPSARRKKENMERQKKNQTNKKKGDTKDN